MKHTHLEAVSILLGPFNSIQLPSQAGSILWQARTHRCFCLSG